MICETEQFPFAETCNARAELSREFHERERRKEGKRGRERERAAARRRWFDGGKRRAHLEILRNGLRKLLESAEYKSFPTAVIRFSRVFGSPGVHSPFSSSSSSSAAVASLSTSLPLFCLIAREDRTRRVTACHPALSLPHPSSSGKGRGGARFS